MCTCPLNMSDKDEDHQLSLLDVLFLGWGIFFG